MDYCNCGLATALTIMMIVRAFENNNISKNWLMKDDATTKAIIPNSIFLLLQFGLSNKNLLDLIRNEVIDLFDKLPLEQSAKYNGPQKKEIYRTQLVSPILKLSDPYQHYFEVSNHDYTLPEYNCTIAGMIENAHCKNAFKNLNQRDYEFIDVKDDQHRFFYQLEMFLYNYSIPHMPKQGKNLAIFMRKMFYEGWNNNITESDFRKVLYFSFEDPNFKKFKDCFTTKTAMSRKMKALNDMNSTNEESFESIDREKKQSYNNTPKRFLAICQNICKEI